MWAARGAPTTQYKPVRICILSQSRPDATGIHRDKQKQHVARYHVPRIRCSGVARPRYPKYLVPHSVGAEAQCPKLEPTLHTLAFPQGTCLIRFDHLRMKIWALLPLLICAPPIIFRELLLFGGFPPQAAAIPSAHLLPPHGHTLRIPCLPSPKSIPLIPPSHRPSVCFDTTDTISLNPIAHVDTLDTICLQCIPNKNTTDTILILF